MENKKSYYAIIPACVRYDKSVSANAKLLYGEITALCNEKGFCWASNSYFSELYGVSIRSITKWIANLEKGGYLKTVLIYKENTREVKERRIYISDPIEEKFDTPRTKVQEGIEQKFSTPPEQKFQDNNTFINTTVNNTKDKTYCLADAKTVLDFLNTVVGSAYKITTKKNQDLIKARMKEGFTVSDFKTVITKKYKEWQSTEMEKYLRPETLFGTKFESYLNQKEVIAQGKEKTPSGMMKQKRNLDEFVQ